MISLLMTTGIDKNRPCYKSKKKNLTLSDFRFINNSNGTSFIKFNCLFYQACFQFVSKCIKIQFHKRCKCYYSRNVFVSFLSYCFLFKACISVKIQFPIRDTGVVTVIRYKIQDQNNYKNISSDRSSYHKVKLKET